MKCAGLIAGLRRVRGAGLSRLLGAILGWVEAGGVKRVEAALEELQREQKT